MVSKVFGTMVLHPVIIMNFIKDEYFSFLLLFKLKKSGLIN